MLHLVLAVLLLAPLAAQQQTPAALAKAAKQKTAAVAKKLAPLLEEAGFKNYRKAGEGVWIISFKGGHAESLEVVVQAQGEMIVVLSSVQEQSNLTAEQMRQLFRANYDANFSKLAIDADGELFAMVELPVETTARLLRKAVDEVAALADDAVGILAPAAAPAPAAATPADSLEPVPPGTGAKLSMLRGQFELSYDPAKWKAEKDEADITKLEHVSGEAWVRVIPDRIEVAPDHFQELVVLNAKAIDPNVKFINESWQTVNGLRADVLRYEATKAGITFTFYNQMYSTTAGTIQIAAWTPSSIFEEYRRDFLELFAGLRKVDAAR